MTNIKFNCLHCKQPLQASMDHSGKTIQCPRCNGALRIPAMTSATVPVYEGQNQVSTTSAGAVWSFVLSLLSFICFGPLTGIPAIICGHVARSNIKRSQGNLTGDGLAVAGLVVDIKGQGLAGGQDDGQLQVVGEGEVGNIRVGVKVDPAYFQVARSHVLDHHLLLELLPGLATPEVLIYSGFAGASAIVELLLARLCLRSVPFGGLFVIMAAPGVFLMGMVSPDLEQDMFREGAQWRPFIEAGDWWRPFTAMFLHSGVTHILFNMWALWLFGPTLERRYGSYGLERIGGRSGLETRVRGRGDASIFALAMELAGEIEHALGASPGKAGR